MLAAFAAAATLGGLTTALGLWLLSGLSAPLPAVARGALFAAAVTGLVLRSLDVVAFPLPQAARQIPREVFDRHPLRSATQFGFALGTGVRTYLVSPLPYVPALAILLLGPPLVGALAMGFGFGLSRGVLPATAVWRQHHRGRRAPREPAPEDRPSLQQ